MKLIFKVFLIVAMFAGCSAAGKQLARITDLAPPQEVNFTSQGSDIILNWRPSTQEDLPNFVGYNVYVSTSSLIFTHPNNLPEPIVLGKTHKHRVAISAEKNFIHVRSRLQNGNLSLPSLPEIIISVE